MGQYYKAVILKKDFRETYKDGKAEVVIEPLSRKLCEHAFFDGAVVNTIVTKLSGELYGYPVIWAGDYMMDIRYNIEGVDMDDLYDHNKSYVEQERYFPYDFTSENGECEVIKEENKHRYLVNLSKKQYVDLHKVLEDNGFKPHSRKKHVLHPLPLLCAVSNGLGGGDYFGQDEELCGTWAYDNIGLELDKVPEGFTELEVHFVYNNECL